MGFSSTAPATVLGTLSNTDKTIEIAIAAVAVVLLVVILLLILARQRGRAKAVAGQSAPHSHDADLPEGDAASPGDGVPQLTFGSNGQADPIGFGAASEVNGFTPPAPPAPPAMDDPPPGTPAGWLPEPSGVPDTLRYWDGSAWTQHVAQRTPT